MAGETKTEAKPATPPAPASMSGPGREDSKIERKKLAKIAGGVLLAMLAVVVLYFALQYSGVLKTVPPAFHEHADFKVFLLGKPHNFSQEKYMTKASCGPTQKTASLKDIAHLHNGNGEVAHVHRENVSWGDFFWSLGIKFNATCFILDTKERYCDEGNNSLKFFVNGEKNYEFDAFPVRDLDRVLISYGPDKEDVKAQYGQVTNDACIYSNKCPERNVPLPLEEGCGTG